MKKILILSLCVLALCVSCAKAETTVATTVETSVSEYVPQNDTQKYYYAMGNYLASTYNMQYSDMDLEAFVGGVQAYMGGKELTVDEINQIVDDYINNVVSRMSVDNLKKAEDFLAENKTKDGVITTESGLEYTVLTEGTGAKPSDGASVSVKYTLSLLDGTVVDTSGDSPVTFSLYQVIPGFSEAVKQMNVGSKIRAWVHPDLGYGENGTNTIEPQTLLIFDIELVSFTQE